LSGWFGTDFINILSEEKTDNCYYGKIDKPFLKDAIEDFTQFFYLCGPPDMMKLLASDLKDLGINKSKIICENLN